MGSAQRDARGIPKVNGRRRPSDLSPAHVPPGSFDHFSDRIDHLQRQIDDLKTVVAELREKKRRRQVSRRD